MSVSYFIKRQELERVQNNKFYGQNCNRMKDKKPKKLSFKAPKN